MSIMVSEASVVSAVTQHLSSLNKFRPAEVCKIVTAFSRGLSEAFERLDDDVPMQRVGGGHSIYPSSKEDERYIKIAIHGAVIDCAGFPGTSRHRIKYRLLGNSL